VWARAAPGISWPPLLLTVGEGASEHGVGSGGPGRPHLGSPTVWRAGGWLARGRQATRRGSLLELLQRPLHLQQTGNRAAGPRTAFAALIRRQWAEPVASPKGSGWPNPAGAGIRGVRAKTGLPSGPEAQFGSRTGPRGRGRWGKTGGKRTLGAAAVKRRGQSSRLFQLAPPAGLVVVVR